MLTDNIVFKERLVDIDLTQVSDAAKRQMDRLEAATLKTSDTVSFEPLEWDDSFKAVFRNFIKNQGTAPAARMLDVPESRVRSHATPSCFRNPKERWRNAPQTIAIINICTKNLTSKDGIPEFLIDGERAKVTLGPGDVLYINKDTTCNYKARDEVIGGACILVIFSKQETQEKS